MKWLFSSSVLSVVKTLLKWLFSSSVLSDGKILMKWLFYSVSSSVLSSVLSVCKDTYEVIV